LFNLLHDNVHRKSANGVDGMELKALLTWANSITPQITLSHLNFY